MMKLPDLIFIATAAALLQTAEADIKIQVVDDTHTAGDATDANSPYVLLVGKAAGGSAMSVTVPPEGKLAWIAADVSYVAASVTANVSGDAVGEVTLTSGGSGYQATGEIPVVFEGGLGNPATSTAATATATVTGGVITSINFNPATDGGSGYASPPTVTVPNSMTPNRINQMKQDVAAGASPGPYSVVSPYSGLSRPVYYFTAGTIGSGALMVFKNEGTGSSPFVYSDNANPSPATSNFRFDQCELTYNETIQTGANMTTIDQMGFPMRLEVFATQEPSEMTEAKRVGERIFYGPISEILSKFPGSLSGEIYKKGAGGPVGGWTAADGMGAFLRALGPGQVAAKNPTGNPAPYPSFMNYLDSIKASQPTTKATGTAVLGNFQVASVTIGNQGAGYTSGEVEVVATGGTVAPGASAAVLFAQVVAGTGNMVGILVQEPGGYSVAPTGISITPQSGSGGSGATATLATGKQVGSVLVGGGGSGHNHVAPAVTFAGGGGAGAVGVAVLDAAGDTVESVTLLDQGAGYSSAPDVYFSSFNITGSANNVDYNYAGNLIDSPDGNGYKMVLNGTTYQTNTTIPSGGTAQVDHLPVNVPANAELTVNLPAETATATATVTLGDGVVNAANVTTAGTGYTSAPTVVFQGGGGSGAAATAVLTGPPGDSTVATISITNGGTGYTSAPAITFTGGGSPTQLPVAEAVVSYAVTGITVTDGGKGYMSNPVVKVEGPALSGGTPATATATATISDVTGAVTSIAVNTVGSGYLSTSVPVVTVDDAGGSADNFLYGATLNADSFWVGGYPRSSVRQDTNISYGAMTRDVLAAINFGFVGGNQGNTSAEWYSPIPNDAPFGSARTTRDGFYNPWAALIYNYSDAYGFAFSDKVNPSPLIDLPYSCTLRITILPDDWLSPPKPVVTKTTGDSIELEWNSIAGASSYEISIVDPPGYTPVSYTPTESAGTQEFTLEMGAGKLSSPLLAGTSYTVRVTAIQGAARTSSYPLQAATSTPYLAVTGSDTFLSTLSYLPPPILLKNGALTAKVGGQLLHYQIDTRQWNDSPSGGSPVTLYVDAGVTQSYPIHVLSGSTVIFSTNMEVTTDSGGTVTAASYYQGGDNAEIAPGAKLTVNLPPLSPLKKFTPVSFPKTSYSQWLTQYPGLSETAALADPDKDGLENLFEYFQGTNPELPGAFGTLAVERTSHYLKLVYPMSKDATGISNHVEWSTDLSGWSAEGVTYDADRDEGDSIVRTARVAMGQDAKLFLRLVISQ